MLDFYMRSGAGSIGGSEGTIMNWIRSTVEAVGSAAALVAFAGPANASATIDLLWARSGTTETSGANFSSANTLRVILTAGPNGSSAASVSVDFTGLPSEIQVIGYSNTPGGALPNAMAPPIKVGSRIEGINSASIVGPGLAAGESHQLGTVTFHGVVEDDTVYEIRSDANGSLDNVYDGGFNIISDATTFNRAYITGRGQRACDFVIEVNMLRGGSPTVAVNTTKNITAKARIAKGTALSDTTLDATLRIDAVDGSEIFEQQSAGPIRLEVGKGGAGDTLAMNVSQCNSGAIDFVATFFGFDDDGDFCEGSRRITKACE